MAESFHLTSLRGEVYELVKASKQPVTAYVLLALLSAQRGRATPPSIYRALKYLTSCGLVRRLESPNAYVACSRASAGRWRVFCVCDSCGSVAEMESGEAEAAVRDVARSQNFVLRKASADIRGVCAA